ncbi:hypothetical protein [Mycobacterium conspicuum]|uniref:Uncharacterized protein n=1 Tax=Mycobacterium conspicuum TaxID=44010 RepID=A0A1X1SZK4_9MYCO|nr:hypothetical protein [Mycobacterium conspicuum]ORV37259.1 hypothetical protein AWC00_23120 [Mycobacterium conspicuum]BBZ38735.1 hypothetical protein MCNS_17980 [Mycobacterium conspicuum]
MPRRVTNTNTSGLRGLLLAEYRRSLKRWRISGRTYEVEEALNSGAAAGVSSAQIMRALFAAGLPCADYCHGGRHYGATFLLDERGELLEVH